jgi:putative pyruvate formate lyase activating enzyme
VVRVFAPADRREVALRAQRARDSLASCELCEHRCGANRLAGERSPCHLTDASHIFKRHISFAEEIELLPSYMVYFGGCNFRCRFCVQAPTCFKPDAGERVDASATAHECAHVVARGGRTINLLGGEPSLHLHTILDIAAAADEPLPLVLNTNMYMTPGVIDALRGVVSLYVADFKFGSDACARRIASADRYVEVVTRNLLHASEHAEVIIRHLVMPGHTECCLRPVAEWVAAHLPSARFTLMTSYVPAYRAAKSGDELSRCLTEAERAEAEAIVAELGLNRSDA